MQRELIYYISKRLNHLLSEMGEPQQDPHVHVLIPWMEWLVARKPFCGNIGRTRELVRVCNLKVLKAIVTFISVLEHLKLCNYRKYCFLKFFEQLTTTPQLLFLNFLQNMYSIRYPVIVIIIFVATGVSFSFGMVCCFVMFETVCVTILPCCMNFCT